MFVGVTGVLLASGKAEAQAAPNRAARASPARARVRDGDRKVVMPAGPLLDRIGVNPDVFGGKPILRGRRLAVEHVLAMLAAGDTVEEILVGYPWMEREDIRACLEYAGRMVAHERIELKAVDPAS
jgi:uncharacterized protein (DUF433 family)